MARMIYGSALLFVAAFFGVLMLAKCDADNESFKEDMTAIQQNIDAIEGMITKHEWKRAMQGGELCGSVVDYICPEMGPYVLTPYLNGEAYYNGETRNGETCRTACEQNGDCALFASETESCNGRCHLFKAAAAKETCEEEKKITKYSLYHVKKCSETDKIECKVAIDCEALMRNPYNKKTCSNEKFKGSEGQCREECEQILQPPPPAQPGQCVACSCSTWSGSNYSDCRRVTEHYACGGYCVQCKSDGVTPMKGYWTSHQAECDKYAEEEGEGEGEGGDEGEGDEYR